MRVIYINTNEPDKMAKASMEQSISLGYESIEARTGKDYAKEKGLKSGLTIDGLTYTPKSPFKPYVLRDACDILDFGEEAVYIDNDAFIMKPLDVFDEEFDVGLTFRREQEQHLDQFYFVNGKVNAGVIFFRNTEATRRFFDKWIELMPKTRTGSDQEALHMLLDAPECRLRRFPTDLYNYYYFNENKADKAYILHFKGNHKKLWTQYVKGKN